MLVSENDVNNYNRIKTDLDKLRILVEQSELWIYKKKEQHKDDSGGGTSTVGDTSMMSGTSSANNSLQAEHYSHKQSTSSAFDEDVGDPFVLQELDNGPELDSRAAITKYKQLYKILYSMIQLCVHVQHLPSGEVRRKPRRNDQRLLRNMGVHNIVLELTKISYERHEDRRMRVIMKTAHQFLQSFCYGNAHNQALLHEKIDLTHYPSNEWEATTATHIFKDNALLYNELNERLIQNFVHALEHQADTADDSLGGGKLAYLEFLQTICVIDGHEVKKCQDMIVAELMNSDVMHFSTDKTHIDELCLLMQRHQAASSVAPGPGDGSAESLANWRQIMFHVNLIKVLIAC